MLFSSITFLYYFLPLTILLYTIAPKKRKNAALLLASLVFYAWGEPKYVFLMAGSIVSGYVWGLLIEKFLDKRPAKLFLVLSVITSLVLLGYFKYADFFIDNFNTVTGLNIPLLHIALPIGISFYTFQILSYTIDVYRKTIPAQRNIVSFAAYVSLFPQLIAGPIVRYSDVAKQLTERQCTEDKLALGIRRFILGLSKKVLIANILGELVSVFRDSGEKSVVFYWMYAIAFSLHIYFDFSGYSDMAIGLGRILGFEFMENFNYPFISKSITDFWRRWHISLSSWFRDYVYIPIGGNRVSRARHILNILVVWFLTGMWHGAQWNFILWGLYFGFLLILEKFILQKALKKLPTAASHIYALMLVMIGFVLFNAQSLSGAVTDIAGLFGGGAIPLMTAETLYYLRSYAVVIALAIVGCMPVMKRAIAALDESAKGAKFLRVAEPIALAILLVLCTAYLVDGSFNPFLYFRF